MRAKVAPLYFKKGRNEDFDIQLDLLKEILVDYIEFLDEVPFGDLIPSETDAVLFPQILGAAYDQLDDFKAINVPILIVTTEFGTMAMWDWEVIKYLQSEGVEVIAPYNMDQTKDLARAMAIKRDLRSSKFVVYQDQPAVGGFQPEIFKRFYWFMDECTQRMFNKYGVTLEQRSFAKMGAEAKALPDAEAEKVWEVWGNRLPLGNISVKQRNSALKVYLKLKDGHKLFE